MFVESSCIVFLQVRQRATRKLMMVLFISISCHTSADSVKVPEAAGCGSEPRISAHEFAIGYTVKHLLRESLRPMIDEWLLLSNGHDSGTVQVTDFS